MTTETPTIDGHDAKTYLEDVPDNGRILCVIGRHPMWNIDLMYAEMSCSDRLELVDLMSVNNSIANEEIKWMATLHAAEVGTERWPHPGEHAHPDTYVIGQQNNLPNENVNMFIDVSPRGGKSGLFAVVAGLVLGYKTIYLCGVRMEEGTDYYDEHVKATWEAWFDVFEPHLVPVMGKSNWLRRMYE